MAFPRARPDILQPHNFRRSELTSCYHTSLSIRERRGCASDFDETARADRAPHGCACPPAGQGASETADQRPHCRARRRRAYGGRRTCEGCRSIDVRRWHRERRLKAGQYFSWSWTHLGEPSGGISVRTEANAMVLMYRVQQWQDKQWKSVEQRVPITWTACHLGGQRPWFICPVCSGGRYCGRRVALLYCAGELFACRHCYGLVYASQGEALGHRGLGKARKIRMQLGGGPNLFEQFPGRPKGMHQRTYDRLRRGYDLAAAHSMMGLTRVVDRLQRRMRVRF